MPSPSTPAVSPSTPLRLPSRSLIRESRLRGRFNPNCSIYDCSMGGRAGGRYEPGLDGVRALAVVAVLAFHDGRLPGGFLGVSTFFTLSGLPDHRPAAPRVARSSGASRSRAFYARRIRRLFPAAVVGRPARRRGRGRAARRADLAQLPAPTASPRSANVANWRFLASGQSYANLFATPSPLQHFWSLAVEEQFYLVLAPLIVGRARRAARPARRDVRRAGRDRRGVVRRRLDLRPRTASTARTTAPTPARWSSSSARCSPSRSTGRSAQATVSPRRRARRPVRAWPRWCGRTRKRASATASSSAAGSSRTRCLGCIVLARRRASPGPVQHLCSTAPLRALGRISYGVYVYHWPIFLWLTAARTGLAAFPLTILRVSASRCVVATLSFVLPRTADPGRTRARSAGGAGSRSRPRASPPRPRAPRSSASSATSPGRHLRGDRLAQLGARGLATRVPPNLSPATTEPSPRDAPASRRPPRSPAPRCSG